MRESSSGIIAGTLGTATHRYLPSTVVTHFAAGQGESRKRRTESTALRKYPELQLLKIANHLSMNYSKVKLSFS